MYCRYSWIVSLFLVESPAVTLQLSLTFSALSSRWRTSSTTVWRRPWAPSSRPAPRQTTRRRTRDEPPPPPPPPHSSPPTRAEEHPLPVCCHVTPKRRPLGPRGTWAPGPTDPQRTPGIYTVGVKKKKRRAARSLGVWSKPLRWSGKAPQVSTETQQTLWRDAARSRRESPAEHESVTTKQQRDQSLLFQTLHMFRREEKKKKKKIKKKKMT